MNRYKKLMANSGMIAIGNFGSKLLIYFLIRFYTAYLTPEMYSTADLITQTSKLLMPIMSLGIAEAVFRFALDKENDKREVYSAGLYILGAGSLLLIPVFTVFTVMGLFDGYSYLIVLYVIAANLHGVTTLYIRTKDHFKFFAVQGIINTGTMVVLNILFLAVFKMGVEGYVLSGVIADLFSTFIVFVKEKLWRDIVLPKRIDRNIFRKMLKFSLPMIPTNILWWVTNVSDRYVVKYFEGDFANGLYSVAYKIPSLLVLICSIFIQAWNYSSVKEENEKERKKFFSTVFSAYSAIQFLGSSAIMLVLDILVVMLFDPKFHGAALYIPTLVFSTAFSSLVTFQGSVYTLNKKSMNLLYTAITAALVNVVLNFVLVPNSLFGVKMAGLGAIGAAIATLISYVVVFAVRAINIKKVYPFDMKIGYLVANAVCVGIQCIVATLRPEGYIFYQIPIFIAVIIINLKSLSATFKKLIFKDKKPEMIDN
ncbi:MAG: hypothetical protein E7675_00030 [Ruminococcaceae bacterium]|nr:hypothetical protein [Oscillospiraceae bacterium]